MRANGLSQSGYSLIELMVAVAVMGIVTAQLFIVMGNQKKVYSSNERAVDTQETARMTLDLLSFDTRMGGYMIPSWTAVSSVDGADTDPDRFCVSSVFADPDDTSGPNPMEVQKQRFSGAKVMGGGIAGNSVTVEKLDLNDDGTVDFAINNGVIVASEQETYCARIANVVPGAGPGTHLIQFATSDAGSYITNTAAGHLQAVPANVYELNKDTFELQRNGMLLASQIEDFQAEFWIDFSGNDLDDGDTEFPVNNLNDPDPPGGAVMAANNLIRRVRLTVLAVAPIEDGANAASGHLSYGRPKVANREAAATADRLRRRAFSASVMPRNVAGVPDPLVE
jgi:prepilin-type N-terminal cleavage/methylation domain-containing protein